MSWITQANFLSATVTSEDNFVLDAKSLCVHLKSTARQLRQIRQRL